MFILLNLLCKMSDLRPGMSIQGSSGGSCEILGLPERLWLQDSECVAVQTEHGVLVQHHTVILTVNVDGP